MLSQLPITSIANQFKVSFTRDPALLTGIDAAPTSVTVLMIPTTGLDPKVLHRHGVSLVGHLDEVATLSRIPSRAAPGIKLFLDCREATKASMTGIGTWRRSSFLKRVSSESSGGMVCEPLIAGSTAL